LVDARDKYALLSVLGVDYCVVAPFAQDFARQDAEEFVKNFLKGTLSARALVLGYDTCFGRDRRGNFDFLREARGRYGFELERVNSVLADGEPVASRRIRKFIVDGSLKEGSALLGRRHSVHGAVLHGTGRGNTLLGLPTANLDPGPLLLPPRGVYACMAKVSGSFLAAAVNLGINPSFGGTTPSLEAHLLDYDGDLYGTEIRLYFEAFLRPEQKFASLEELKAGIIEDVSKTRSVTDFIKAEPEFAALHPL
jgi:riboflavin kinase/FMN adenylyltransferase